MESGGTVEENVLGNQLDAIWINVYLIRKPVANMLNFRKVCSERPDGFRCSTGLPEKFHVILFQIRLD